ncbi:MAG: metallophosphoesterase [Kiritimatiellae bacterium]|nr:metallophosphoesterase [Kiritimatiellia bacterium]
MTLRVIWGIFCVLSLVTAFGPVRMLKLPLWSRILVGFFFFLAAQGYLLQKLFDASVMCPDKLPFWLLVPAKWGDIITLMTGVVSLLWIGLRLIRVKCPPTIPLIAGISLGTIMLWLAVRQPPVQEYIFEIPNLPSSAEGLRVAIVADLHIDCWRGQTWCEGFVNQLNEQKPDLVLFTGDQVDGKIAFRQKDLAPLEKIEAPLGKFVISGNHEFMYEAEAYLRYYQALGLTVLDGKTAAVSGLTLIGLPDSRSLTNYESLPILESMMATLPKDACTFLLVHKPGIAVNADELGVDVQFSGHTHGGQFPGLATLMKRFNNGFVRGFYTLPNGLRLFVAPGSASWIGFPYRLYSSELSIFTLKRAT